MIENYKKELSLLLVAIGLWLMITPFTYGYQDVTIISNDLFCGLLLCIFGIASSVRFYWLYFFVFFLIGAWLHFSPLVFWAPESIYYLNDSLVGTLVTVVAFLFLRDRSPVKKSNAIPLGWSYNPSSWSHRIPVIFFAIFCWFVARYLDSYQLKYIAHVWDPLFGNGTEQVLTSKVSRSFPIPDAGLGAFAYSLEALLCWQGRLDRWRSMPWVVLSFGFLALPVGITSIILIILQPLVVNAWCFLCLLIACCMLIIVILSVAEVIATLQCMKQHLARGMSIMEFFIHGVDEEEPFSAKTSVSKRHFFQGITPTWNLVGIVIVAICLLIQATIVSLPPILKTCHFIIGPLMIVFSVCSMAEVLRGLRYLNILLGSWLILCAFIFPMEFSMEFWTQIIFGIIAIWLSFPKGKVQEKYGNWQRLIL